MTTRYRTNADGSAVCPHRDLSVCPACAAADPRLVDVFGAHYLIEDPVERAAMLAEMAERDGTDRVGDMECGHPAVDERGHCVACDEALR